MYIYYIIDVIIISNIAMIKISIIYKYINQSPMHNFKLFFLKKKMYKQVGKKKSLAMVQLSVFSYDLFYEYIY